MEKDNKFMIIGLVATLFCFAVALTCAILRKFDMVSIILFTLVATFTSFSVTFTIAECVRSKKSKK